MRTRTPHRIIAALLLKLLLLDICYPTAAYALTGGPSQPEFEAFEPVTTDQMVDLFTGDFTYNIPLMTVPGPNGGYPINLAYHSAIGMEDEASWVGLGWNINAGEITRNLRGLPDDIDGDNIVKKTHMKPDVTLGLTIGTGVSDLDLEVLGLKLDAASAKHTFYYNNYRGVGTRRDINCTGMIRGVNSTSAKDDGLKWSLGASLDSQTGLGITPGLSFSYKSEKLHANLAASATWHSRQGLTKVDMNADAKIRMSNRNKGNPEGKKPDWWAPMGSGISFSSSSYVPAPFAPTSGTNAKFGITYGLANTTSNLDYLSAELFYSEQRVREGDRTTERPGYGYLYSQNAGEDAVMDLNREKDVPVTRHIPNIPMPVSTYDPMTIKGQGVGGAFRPFRSDVGLFHSPSIRNESHGGEATVELGMSEGWKIGGDVGYTYSDAYGGTWLSGTPEISGDPSAIDLNFQGKNVARPLFEPFYFKRAGEYTASPLTEQDGINGDRPVRFKLEQRVATCGEGFEFPCVAAEVKNNIGSGTVTPVPTTSTMRGTRDKRVQNIEYRTAREVSHDENYPIRPAHIYSGGVPSTLQQFDYTSLADSRLAAISVRNPDGTCYEYALPAMNMEQKDVAFSIGAATIEGTSTIIGEYVNTPVAKWPGGDAADLETNEAGRDEFYSSTKLPDHAHAYLLTAVYSADYVDITGNGPSDDDLGYYTKFNYTDQGVHAWRAPFSGVNYVKGFYSDKEDDKATYSYGKKHIYHLGSIETKTHIAYFITSVREDGRLPSDEPGISMDPFKALKLDKIQLFSKKAPGTPLKQVFFVYAAPADELCQGVPNRASTGGKLTLQRVYFQHLDNTKGQLSPYEFTYDQAFPNGNPSYSRLNIDRWGNYQTYTGNNSAMDNPYTEQGLDEATRNARAAAWALRTIKLPSGGTIHVEYEADDYAYVQGQKAMQMFRIVGTGETSYTSPGTHSGKLKKKHRRIYVDMGRDFGSQLPPQAALEEALKGVKDLYFKTWQNLKEKPGTNDNARDYVEGYCKPVANSAQAYTGGHINLNGTIIPAGRIACFDVEVETLGSGIEVHPFRLAGLQYIRYRRPDLLQSTALAQAGDFFGFTVMLSILRSMRDLLLGYYVAAMSKGWCADLDLNSGETRPSYVRLFTPNGIKYGGGHRVASIRINDAWTEGAAQFGKEYEYRTTNEHGNSISSGVAEYEPLIGGEENPLRKPIWYDQNDSRVSLRHEETYLEEPFGESLYPSPSVGYSRVVVRDLRDEGDAVAADVSTTLGGVTVHEFYTAKDFPVRSECTDLNSGSVHFAPPMIPVPIIGGISVESHGYSQGYAVHLNDMHGKQKSVSTYAACAQPVGQPRTRTSYIYRTEPGAPDRLSNTATVLTDDFTTEQAALGVMTEFYADLDEHNSRSFTLSTDANCQGPTPVPMVVPGFYMSNAQYRAIATTKVIHRAGILDRIVNEVDGANATTQNLVYDAETGEPLLTTIDNAWEEPVYTYTYAAHNSYDGMGGAYTNWNALARLTSTGTPGRYTVSDVPAPNTVFTLGDELITTTQNPNVHYWVTGFPTSNTVELRSASDGTPPTHPTTFDVKVLRSGRRNLQSVKNGSIVALNDPIAPGQNIDNSLLQAFNDEVAYGHSNQFGNNPMLTGYFNCAAGRFMNVAFKPMTLPMEGESSEDVISVFADPYYDDNTYPAPPSGAAFIEDHMAGECNSYIVIPGIHSAYPNYASDNEMNFSFLGFTGQLHNGVDPFFNITYTVNGQNYTREGYWKGFFDCFSSGCIQVLHADATEFEDDFNYDYGDIGSSSLSGNDYRYGRKGIWRPVRQHLFQTDRVNAQGEGTHIDRDGNYTTFTYFDFNDPSTDLSHRWVRRDETTRFSPYGFGLESRDANNIHSAQLYGYDNTQVIATAANATYYEIASEGFEDHFNGLGVAAYQSTYAHGHLPLISSSGSVSFANEGHTGAHAAKLANQQFIGVAAAIQDVNWHPVAGKRYVVSAWFKPVNRADQPKITIVNDDLPYTSGVSVNDDGNLIDGWRKVEVTFTAPTSGTLAIHFGMDAVYTGDALVDDIRIHPADASMTTYVYDPYLYWLKAELDDRNYATFYNYDEEGTLVQVKKETERGVMTLRTTRQNRAQQ